MYVKTENGLDTYYIKLFRGESPITISSIIAPALLQIITKRNRTYYVAAKRQSNDHEQISPLLTLNYTHSLARFFVENIAYIFKHVSPKIDDKR